MSANLKATVDMANQLHTAIELINELLTFQRGNTGGWDYSFCDDAFDFLKQFPNATLSVSIKDEMRRRHAEQTNTH